MTKETKTKTNISGYVIPTGAVICFFAGVIFASIIEPPVTNNIIATPNPPSVTITNKSSDTDLSDALETANQTNGKLLDTVDMLNKIIDAKDGELDYLRGQIQWYATNEVTLPKGSQVVDTTDSLNEERAIIGMITVRAHDYLQLNPNDQVASSALSAAISGIQEFYKNVQPPIYLRGFDGQMEFNSGINGGGGWGGDTQSLPTTPNTYSVQHTYSIQPLLGYPLNAPDDPKAGSND